MNAIRKLNQINQKELEQSTSYEASWHYDYRDTSYIYIGGLPYTLEEKDIIIIFSQYGIPSHINLVKDKTTGKSRGFCYLKYRHYKSCVLAVDNLNGIKVYDRLIKVDHVYFKLRGEEKEDDYLIDYSDIVEEPKAQIEQGEVKLIENKPTDSLQEDDELKDPMAEYLDKPVEDDEFKDPMAEFMSTKKKEHRSHRSHRSHRDKDSSSHRSHRDKESSSHRSHRSHRHRRDEDDKKSDREKSPTRTREG